MDHLLSYSFVASLFPDFCDQELISHIRYGVRWKAEYEHLQFRFPPHMESMNMDYRNLVAQFQSYVEMGMATSHPSPPFDPSHYVSLGSTTKANGDISAAG